MNLSHHVEFKDKTSMGEYYKDTNKIIGIAMDYSNDPQIQLELLISAFMTHLGRLTEIAVQNNPDIPLEHFFEEADGILDAVTADGKRMIRESTRREERP